MWIEYEEWCCSLFGSNLSMLALGAVRGERVSLDKVWLVSATQAVSTSLPL